MTSQEAHSIEVISKAILDAVNSGGRIEEDELLDLMKDAKVAYLAACIAMKVMPEKAYT